MEMEERQLGFSIVEGERIYAVGDVHGCRAELERLLQLIRRDVEARPPTITRLLFLGDVIDRGSESAAVFKGLLDMERRLERFHVLYGNHEQLMVNALGGDLEAMALWLNVGGGDTLLSFGVGADLVREGACERLLSAAQDAVGQAPLVWLSRRPLTFRSNHVLFVHAGVRPGVPIDRQDPKDLLWIREPFLSDESPRDILVVHGHTVYKDGPFFGVNRIGIDTGAYATGRLTALALEGDRVWALTT